VVNIALPSALHPLRSGALHAHATLTLVPRSGSGSGRWLVGNSVVPVLVRVIHVLHSRRSRVLVRSQG
jgi:hypothetical protein